jgi:hypothetical protein
MLALFALAFLLSGCGGNAPKTKTWSPEMTIGHLDVGKLRNPDGVIVQIYLDTSDGNDHIKVIKGDHVVDGFSASLMSKDPSYFEDDIKVWLEDPDGTGPEPRVIKYQYILEDWSPQ